MPPTPPRRDPEHLLAEMVSLRLTDEASGQTILNNFRAAGHRSDGMEFVTYLAKAGVLTSYQGSQLLVGNGSRLFCGPYVLEEPIGQGELGPAYLAVGKADRKSYAIEVLPLRNLWNVHLAKTNLRPIQQLPAHPALIPIVTIDSTAWCHYLVWPYVEGESLDRIIHRDGPADPVRAAAVAAGIAEGLAMMHKRGLYYGVLKPPNVVIGPDGRPRMLKLGTSTILAENLAEEDSLLDTTSNTNFAIGMIDYTAPELVGEAAAQTVAGDAYSLGGLVYFLVTGRSPFPDGSAVDKMMAVVRTKPVPVRELRADVPEKLSDLVDRLLSKSPGDRPTDQNAIRETLLAFTRPDFGPAQSASLFVPPPIFQGQATTVFPETGLEAPRVRPKQHPGDSDALSWASVSRPTEPDDSALGPPSEVAAYPPSYQPIPVEAPAVSPARPPEPAAPVAATDWSPLRPEKTPAAPPVDRPTPPRTLRLEQSFWRFARSVRPSVPPRDLVQISVFGPTSFAFGPPAAFHVYLHQRHAFVAVASLAHTNRPENGLLATGFATRLLVRGRERTALHLGIGGVTVPDPLVTADWTGATWLVTFPFVVPPTLQPTPIAAVVTLGLDGVVGGKVEFSSLLVPMTGG